MQVAKKTKVLAVGSQKETALLEKILKAVADVEVVAAVRNASAALELVASLDPDVICLGARQPVPEGLALTREILTSCPRPILVVGEPQREKEALQLVDSGALGFVPLPGGLDDPDYAGLSRELAARIRIVAGVRVIHRVRGGEKLRPGVARPETLQAKAPSRMLVIGSSTGGPTALRTILSRLPADFHLPVVCVQHIGTGFLQGLTKWLGEQCPLKVTVAQEGGRPVAGMVYFPPEGRHLEFDAAGRFTLSQGAPYHGHRPSITVAMRSAALRYGGGAVGVLLTGMGDDGAEGLDEISRAGGVAIAQDEKSCVVFGMPKRAIELGAPQLVLPLYDIAAALIALRR